MLKNHAYELYKAFVKDREMVAYLPRTGRLSMSTNEPITNKIHLALYITDVLNWR